MLRVSLWDGVGDFERHVTIEDAGTIPEIMIVDERHYVRYRTEDTAVDGVARYRLAGGRHTIYTQAVPIYVAKMFERPLIIEAKRLRWFSGCHGATYTRSDQELCVAWHSKMTLQVRGMQAFRVNGAWCPEIVRDPGVSVNKANKAEHASKALEWVKRWQLPVSLSKLYRMSVIGVDEYGRFIGDLVKIVRPNLNKGPEIHDFAVEAVKSGLFLPTRLEVQ